MTGRARKRTLLGPADVQGEELRGYDLGPERHVLVSRVAGRWCAIDGWCNHAGCLLSAGRREGRAVVCPCHEAAFDLETGKNQNAPELCGDQRPLRVEEDGGRLYLIEE